MDRLTLDGTIYDIRYHNSKIDDNNWVDLIIRVQGEAGITAAMRMNRAKDKIVSISFEENG